MNSSVVEKDVRDAFFDKIYDLACKDKDLIFITADADAFSLRKFKNDFPERFINVGVAEQTMVLLATGLALCGKKVFIYSIIPFIVQRALEHIKVNICSMNLPVSIIGCGAGLAFGFDGPTHHANQDLATMKTMPGMKIISPCDARSSMLSAVEAYESNTPVYVRLDKGSAKEIYTDNDNIELGVFTVKPRKKVNIISTGFMTLKAVEVFEKLNSQGISVGVFDVSRIKPINSKILCNIISDSESIIVLEEHSLIGGLGSSIADLIVDSNINTKMVRIGLPDKQIFEYGDRDWLHEIYGLNCDAIVDRVLNEIVGDESV